ncbi:DUF86 domain-containing protein [Virgibacillus sp. 179-BFC.A HS]|uniref:DUF86 domain-containing protein n=1 Tax=Tigheibacillus jepli TaxID=3035914 RepID=A0ABU5CFZ5_9BACI|nr:DUF86 domain-containing protein [Virgibacillus sp. 179-BFC.A HS]MDY0405234.1 DUF86 domain-containing protein [Virgibacillus sp. 179-BFC.A HS]
MYFVERKKIEATLIFMEKLLEELKEPITNRFRDQLALERIAHTLIEAIIDTGNMMIDGFIMRDPGGYEDIIDILTDEKVLLEKDSDSLKKVIGLRNLLVRDYINIDHDQIKQVLETNSEALTRFSSQIRTYLHTELDVANAFTNDENS